MAKNKVSKPDSNVEENNQVSESTSGVTSPDVLAALDDTQRKVVEWLDDDIKKVGVRINKIKTLQAPTEAAKLEEAEKLSSALGGAIENLQGIVNTTKSEDYKGAIEAKIADFTAQKTELDEYIKENSEWEKTSGPGASGARDIAYSSWKARKNVGFRRKF